MQQSNKKAAEVPVRTEWEINQSWKVTIYHHAVIIKYGKTIWKMSLSRAIIFYTVRFSQSPSNGTKTFEDDLWSTLSIFHW